jgi:hypothetical protein
MAGSKNTGFANQVSFGGRCGVRDFFNCFGDHG